MKRPDTRSPSAVSLAVGLAAASSAAAQPVVPVFSAETGLVNVAVTVEDAQGRPIDGLTARDFVVSEDGRRQVRSRCARAWGAGHDPSTPLDVALARGHERQHAGDAAALTGRDASAS